MTSAHWKAVWSPDHLIATVDRPELPPVARSFLHTHGLPKILVVEVVGDNAAMDFEWSFRLLKKELVSYTETLRWGGTRDPVRDRLWSNQMVIGEEEFCNGRAAICVHATEEYVSRIDCELPAPRDLGLFVNSSLPKFGESILAAVKWAAEHQHAQKGRRRALYAELVEALARIDPAITAWNGPSASYWPSMFQGAFDDDEDLLSFDITCDPKRSKPRY